MQRKVRAAFTRSRVIEAAVEGFFERGIAMATLEDVAARAGVTRGAVYGHFSGKSGLVAAVIDCFHWPLDIGDDTARYREHSRPLRLLHDQLCARISDCMQNQLQRQVLALVLDESGFAEWPKASIDRVADLQTKAIGNLSRIMEIAQARRQLRIDTAPYSAACCLHTMGIGVLSEHVGKVASGIGIDTRQCFRLLLDGIECITK